MKTQTRLLAKIAALTQKVSAEDFKEYKKDHPGTKKTPSDPMFDPEKHDLNHFHKKFSESFDKHHDDLNKKNYFSHQEAYDSAKKRWDIMTPEQRKQMGVESEDDLKKAHENHVKKLKDDFKTRMQHGTITPGTGKTKGGFGNALFNVMKGIHGPEDVENVKNHVGRMDNKLSRRVFQDMTGHKLPKNEKLTREFIDNMVKKKTAVARKASTKLTDEQRGILEILLHAQKKGGGAHRHNMDFGHRKDDFDRLERFDLIKKGGDDYYTLTRAGEEALSTGKVASDDYYKEMEAKGYFSGRKLQEEALKHAAKKLPSVSAEDLKTLYGIVMKANEHFDGEPTSAVNLARMMAEYYAKHKLKDFY